MQGFPKDHTNGSDSNQWSYVIPDGDSEYPLVEQSPMSFYPTTCYPGMDAGETPGYGGYSNGLDSAHSSYNPDPNTLLMHDQYPGEDTLLMHNQYKWDPAATSQQTYASGAPNAAYSWGINEGVHPGMPLLMGSLSDPTAEIPADIPSNHQLQSGMTMAPVYTQDSSKSIARGQGSKFEGNSEGGCQGCKRSQKQCACVKQDRGSEELPAGLQRRRVALYAKNSTVIKRLNIIFTPSVLTNWSCFAFQHQTNVRTRYERQERQRKAIPQLPIPHIVRSCAGAKPVRRVGEKGKSVRIS